MAESNKTIHYSKNVSFDDLPEDKKSPKKFRLLDEDETAFFISAGGPLSKSTEFFEERSVQIELLKQIVKSFNENKISVLEAGTGVGKSYAYLIPSILWAIKNKERVVISTGTINLQQQLCEKDIPAVEKIINQKIKFILMKGRQNYVCRRRLMDAVAVLDLFENESEEIKRIAKWSETSSNGSKSDMTIIPSENVWSRINSESDACMGNRCPFFAECFVMKVRKEAANSNILVVNHHLLFADIQSRMNGAGYEDAAVLPPYKYLVFDEAHGIENAATSFFSESMTRFKIYKLINQMYRKRRNSYVGHLCDLGLLSKNDDIAQSSYELVSKIKSTLSDCEIAALDLIGNSYSMRLCENTARDFGPLLVAINELANALGKFIDVIRTVIEGINDEDLDEQCVWESKIILRRLDSYVILLKDFNIWNEKKDDVFWIQKKRLPPSYETDLENRDFIIFTQTPLDISFLMNEGVFEPMNCVVHTSATLKTGNNFYYWMNRTGVNLVESERIVTDEFDSPFPYEKNMLFAVPSDAPFPDSPEYQQYIESVIPKLINAANGKTLVLFTSYESLKNAYNNVKAVMKGFSGRIMRQGEDDNAKLLEHFKLEKESVLFATDSFWQGVDVPGESLSQVIIVKLPFTVPNDPVFVARSEAIEKKGRSSFMELSVPEAVIKFRQGVGRLIRRSDDKGVVVVLDRRIYEKRYGSFFVICVEKAKKCYEPMNEIVGRIKRMLE